MWNKVKWVVIGVSLGWLLYLNYQTDQQLRDRVDRIDLESSTTLEQATNYEQREYAVILRYYFKADTCEELVNKAVKGKIDRLRKHLLDNQVNTDKNWAALIIDTISYNVKDDENDDEKNLHIAEFEITIQHHNVF